VRKVYKDSELKKRAKTLITPTKIYVKEIAALRAALKKAGYDALGMAHITGEGIPGNAPRFLPKGCAAKIDASTWRLPRVMAELQRDGKISSADMWDAFNMGIGMVVCVRREAVRSALKANPKIKLIGEVVRGKNEVILENAQ
jgi:phosphoribosylaminoimidazole (AIR) synthetase